MRKLALIAAILGVAAVGTFAIASAVAGGGDTAFQATLTGYNETTGPGSISTTAGGTFRAQIDEHSQTITYRLSYHDLETDATQAHIHFAQQHVAGGVIAFLCSGGDKPACPARSGTVEGTIDAQDIIGPAGQGIEAGSFGEVVSAFRAGAIYANVHSTRWPAGEIRGQVGGHDDDDGGGDD